ncbi:winged helix DNA-binding protein [Sphingomicrobium marinum]|uniref:winged helix DNA-binding protein n=1 Tax=Sphingomicrobium marinum TaxID=1227950 RepID=UPI00223EFD04|nr:winged helix DNA-binding protein [Sphingomicrobium marinum]
MIEKKTTPAASDAAQKLPADLLNRLVELADTLDHLMPREADGTEGSSGAAGDPLPRLDAVLGNLEDVQGGISHAMLVRRMISLRRLREEVFPKGLFADPAWDMLLDLYGAHIAQHRVPVSSLCVAAEVPATTALRWISKLDRMNLIDRERDPHDARRVFISLRPDAVAMMRDYFSRVAEGLAAAA